jgi:hypothetical protein
MAGENAGFNIASMFSGAQSGVPNAAAKAATDANPPAKPDPTGTKPVVPTTTEVPDPNANNKNPDGTPKTTTSSPLDSFQELFKVDDTKQPAKNPLAEKLMELDPSKFSQAVSKMDFTRTLNQELVSKALQGDASAFNQALNQALQGTFATVVQMMVGINEAAFRKNNDRFESVLGNRFRDFQINFSKPENKALQHPAAQPVLAAMRKHIADLNPELSPSDVSRKAEDYFLAMGAAMSEVTKATQDTKAAGGGGNSAPDWTKFLEEGSGSI